ncbi:hypothetical protein AB0D33_24370 [Streptomyces sp. NPDC048404]
MANGVGDAPPKARGPDRSTGTDTCGAEYPEDAALSVFGPPPGS